MTFTLAPIVREATQSELNSVVSSWRGMGADAKTNNDGTNIVLSVALPYQTPLGLRDDMLRLAKGLTDRAEWSLVRASLSPKDIEWNETDGLLTRTIFYHEETDLSPACRAFTTQLDLLGQNLKPLEAVPASDTEGQLKRSLLQYAQRGWQTALANGHASYRAGTDEGMVGACSAKSFVWTSSTWRPERVMLVVGCIEVVGISLLVALRNRRLRGKRARETESNS
jgi:hypothetical protein